MFWNRLASFLFVVSVMAAGPFFYAGALLIWVVTRPFDPRLRLLHLYACFWSTCHYWTMPTWKFVVSGKEYIDRKATYVVVSNHQSQLDILAAFRTFFHFKWVSKIEVFRLPFIGWNMRLNGYIPLKRGDKDSILEMLEKCRQTLREGNSVFIFPEGTRSETGILRPFKPGAFQLAHELKLPILPIAIDGTRDVLPKYSLELKSQAPMKIQILPPVAYEDFQHMSVEETAAFFRRKIGAHVSAHKEEVVAEEPALAR